MLALLLALGLIVLGTLLLVYGADWFLDGVNDLARAISVSALVLGVVLAGLEPDEMLTAAIASARGAPPLALGDVVGTNITITTAALGLSALIFPMTIDRALRRQAIIATLVSIIPVALLFFGVVTRIAGVLLLLIFIVYTIFLFRTDRATAMRITAPEIDDDDNDDDGDDNPPDLGRAGRGQTRGLPYADGALVKDVSTDGAPVRRRFTWKPALLTFGGLAAVAVGGPAIVEGALRLSQAVGLSQGAIGATIVSLGTGAEMIALGISAARKRQASILVGGILGSFAYNLLVTLGLAAAIHPLAVDYHLIAIALPVMIGVHLVLLALIWHGSISRWLGALLLAIYVAYLIVVVLVPMV